MILKKISILLFVVFTTSAAFAHLPVEWKKKKVNNLIQLRNDCAPASVAVDMDINNVRARLRVGGDLWWDGQGNGRFVVPKPAPGAPEVSALFAGGVWLGGLDPAGNLKAAITQYPSGNVTDFYPGPLNEMGETEADICSNWDRFFPIDGDNVRRHISVYDNSDGTINCEDIPDDVKYWPGRGNPFWAERYNFDLPDQNLGAFWDEPGGKAGIYDPCEGDFPLINIRDCEPFTRQEAKELVPDQMFFWIYNDAGNNHLETGADKIQMEIQVQAFAYATNDEVNDMTFYRYKLINKAIDDIQDCYFAMWTDPDLGCYLDDFVGCDVERSLAYVYNEDALDGNIGDACSGGVPTYGDNIPILGIDYFRGPRGPKVFRRDDDGNVIMPLILDDPTPGTGELDTLVELGMSSFVYVNSGANEEPPGTRDPQNGVQAYNVLQGLWPDGTPVTFGGQIENNSGYNPGSTDTVSYVFPGDPNDNNAWSMCTAGLPFGDRRTVQATGPILLQAGGLPEELIVGTVFVPDLQYPCPDITRLKFADDIAQSLFNNCFDITDGPDAPDVCAIELDKQLVLMLTNDSLIANSNNANLQYRELDLQAPEQTDPPDPNFDPFYVFEGYKLYQLANASVSVSQLDDPENAQLIRQVDVKNGVTEIYNYRPVANPEDPSRQIFIPELQVNGSDDGISSTFNVLTDAFDAGQGRLVNHTDYYFTVVAYAYNKYEPFNEGVGQRRPYLEGRGNVKTYTFTPRPQVYQELNSAYGQQPQITRIEGVGTGVNFLELIDGEEEAILDGSAEGVITYESGQGPFEVKVVDPLNIKDGKYRLEIIGDYTDEDNEFESDFTGETRWKLTNLDSGEELLSEVGIGQANEQIVYNEGFSIAVNQAAEPGNEVDNNGAIGQTLEYADPSGPQWWNGSTAAQGFNIVDGEGNTVGNAFSYLENADVDPSNLLAINGTGAFTPLQLTRWSVDPEVGGFFVSPNWRLRYGLALQRNYIQIEKLNNVNIVMTSDKSKWSRCVVVESASSEFIDAGLSTEGGAAQFDLRRSASVDKEGDPDGDGESMGWFPGYAIDVETGQRLNIFFGENSGFNDERSEVMLGAGNTDYGIGDDMIFNPNNVTLVDAPDALPAVYDVFGGGQHFIYVTRTNYDECESIRNLYSSGAAILQKAKLMGLITHTAFPITSTPLLSVGEGLIPNDVTFKVRVTNRFRKETDILGIDVPASFEPRKVTNIGDLPTYEFAFEGVSASDREIDNADDVLSEVSVVPNPYYAYSAYETSSFDKSVKITNLPPRATISIYSLDGKFIRQYIRDEVPLVKGGSNPAVRESQIYPALEWDLNNEAGIPVASGVYIFHIEAPDLNASRSIKWFGVNRRFDPTGL